MKFLLRIMLFLILAIFLIGCGQAIFDPAPTATLSGEMTAIHTHVAATVHAQMTDAVPTVTITPSPTITATFTHTRAPEPTLIPTIDPTKIPDLLESSLSIETLDAFNGHNLRRITGWSNGFDGFEWMDGNHLLLYPIVGMNWAEMAGKIFLSYPEVINLNSGKVWLPPSDKPLMKYRKPTLPRWSAQPGVLLASESDTSTGMYSADGDLIRTYEGNLIGVSPSGTKILISTPFVNSTWIDLPNGKTVVFALTRILDNSYIRPIWSADEMHVYADYHFYVNAKTGESFQMIETMLDNEKTALSFNHTSGTWVLGETYMLPQWSVMWDAAPDFLIVLDPAEKTYRNLSILAGITHDSDGMPVTHPCNTNSPSTTIGGRYVWMDCIDGGRLIDLDTFTSQIYPDYLEARLDWSTDGSFALITRDGDSVQKILSAASKELKPVPDDIRCLTWHPTTNTLVFLSTDGRTLTIFDLRSMSVQKKFDLPVDFYCFDWNNTHDKMVLIGEDNSLWKIDYPRLSNLVQLTSPITRLGWMIWSPDDTQIAFPVGPDIYIVDTNPTK